MTDLSPAPETTARAAGPLTPAQLAALRCAASGHTSATAATLLGCPRASVDTRIRDAIAALGAASRAHAIAIAIVRGLISFDEVDVPDTPADHRPVNVVASAGADERPRCACGRPWPHTTPEDTR